MAIKLKLNCNPYTRKNSLSYCDDSQEETELDWKFVRIRNGLLKDWLEAKEDWKGFFAELYEVFSSESVALFFLGIKEDYKKLIDAYQKYDKREKMVVSFHINPGNLLLKDLPCEFTDNISLDCFAPERIIEEISALIQLCQKIALNITDLPNIFITECLEVIQSNLKPIEKICSLYEKYNLYKEDFAKQKEIAHFENIKNEFYNEVVYSDKGPGADAFIKYYESMDPATAEKVYKQVVTQEQTDSKVQEYASAYAAMKPKEAAGIFEAMQDDLDLAAKILNTMAADDRGKILGVMDKEVAARLTKIMEPES